MRFRSVVSATLPLCIVTLAACGGRVETVSDETHANRESVSVDSTPGPPSGADGGASASSTSGGAGGGGGGGLCSDLAQHGLNRQWSEDEIGSDLDGQWLLCSSSIEDIPSAVAGLQIDGNGYGAFLVRDASGTLVRGDGPLFALNVPVNTTWINRQADGVTRFYAIDVYVTPYAIRIREQDASGKDTGQEAKFAPTEPNAWMSAVTAECGTETNWRCDYMPGQW